MVEKLAQDITKASVEKLAGWEKRWLQLRQASGKSAPSNKEYYKVLHRLKDRSNDKIMDIKAATPNLSKAKRYWLMNPDAKIRGLDLTDNTNLAMGYLMERLSAARNIAGAAPDTMGLKRRLQRLIDKDKELQIAREVDAAVTPMQLLKTRDKSDVYARAWDKETPPKDVNKLMFLSGKLDIPIAGYSKPGTVLSIGSRRELAKQFPNLRFTPHVSSTHADNRTKYSIEAKKDPSYNGLNLNVKDADPYYEAVAPYSALTSDPTAKKFIVQKLPAVNEGKRMSDLSEHEILTKTRLLPKEFIDSITPRKSILDIQSKIDYNDDQYRKKVIDLATKLRF